MLSSYFRLWRRSFDERCQDELHPGCWWEVWCGRRDLNPHGACAPTDFLTLRGFRRPAGNRVQETLRQVCGLDYTFTMTVRFGAVRPAGAARLVSTPSPPEFSVGAWLGIAISQGSPNLSSSASPVSRRALKLRLSPMRLPIPPRPRGHYKYKAHATLRVSFAMLLATFFLRIILMAAVSRRVLMWEA
jgi:hypothetical protein